MDRKAKRILFDTYWSSSGWKREPFCSPDDFQYARSVGYMFDPFVMSHDQVLSATHNAFSQLSLKDIRDAFLASLSSRRLEWRSALGSYAIAQILPAHSFTGNLHCAICGQDYRLDETHFNWNVFNFERFKWGGSRHLQPAYLAFDLLTFKNFSGYAPSDHDVGIFRQILAIIQQLPPNATPNDLERRLSKIFASNQSERRVLITILGLCGIIQPKSHPGFLTTFVPYQQRMMPPGSKNDWEYPLWWWRGQDGINPEALNFYFGDVL